MKKLFFTAIAVVGFGISGWANNSKIEFSKKNFILKNELKSEKKEVTTTKKLDCNKIYQLNYTAVIEQGGSHYQATFIAYSAKLSCEASNGIF